MMTDSKDKCILCRLRAVILTQKSLGALSESECMSAAAKMWCINVC